MNEFKEYTFRDLLIEPVRNGIYKKKEFHGRGARIVNMRELFAFPRLRDVDMKRVEITNREREKVLLKKGDLIFARMSLTAEGAGKCSLVYEITEETTFESSIIRARVKPEKAIPEFIFYYFNSLYGKYLLGTILRQVAVSGITGSDLMALVLKIPDIHEQKAIAEILSSLDDKIDLLHHQNKTLEQMAETLFRQWFVEEAKEDWEVEKIGKYVTVVDNRGKTPYPLIEVNALGKENRLVDYSVIRKYVAEDTFNNWFRNSVQKYDTLLSTVGSIGAFSMFLIEKGNIAQNVIGLHAKDISQNYLYQALKYRMKEVLSLDIGGVQPSIKVPHLLSLMISIPSKRKQDDFDNQVIHFLEKMNNNYIQIRTLEKIRDTLLPKLMSGEVRVKY
ncbi:MAG: restriction endonuclease subunit S [Desulfobacteraceae bacterium]|nr:restriction endonuclease subunit S [Desulfobacteraceae bacterium]